MVVQCSLYLCATVSVLLCYGCFSAMLQVSVLLSIELRRAVHVLHVLSRDRLHRSHVSDGVLMILIS